MLRRRRSPEAPGKPRRRIKKLRLLLLLLLLALVASVAFLYGLVTAIAGELPTLDPANASRVQENGFIYDRTGKTQLAVLRGDEARLVVTSEEIAPVMKQAIVAVEDRRYWEHDGVDIRGIFRAVWADISNKEFTQGGSTITQQLIKNTLISSERTVSRKLKEAALAWQMERRWSKDRILTAYLNTVYFGNHAYGIEMAARVYFQKRARDLTLPEAALLAGIPVNPAAYDPVVHPDAARTRRETVLRLMLEQRLITRAQFVSARLAPLPNPDRVRLPGIQGRAGYFTDYVIWEQLVRRYGVNRVFGGGLRVRTSIDLELQKLARDAIQEHLGPWLKRDPARGLRAALVAIDPQQGEVLAMVGGWNYHEEQFNLAVDGVRQPGSAFKPFVLATALADGFSPHMTYVSAPRVIPFDGQYWQVRNYQGAYIGRPDLLRATQTSDNAVFAQLTVDVGPTRVARMAHRLGIKTPLNGFFSIGLGGEYVNPLEMARAYSTFAFGGRRVDSSEFGNQPRAVLDIEVGKKKIGNARVIERVLQPNDARWMNQILQYVVRGGGTGRRAAVPGRVIAGKTGTTDTYADAWFVGYTPELVVAVWVGYPESPRPMETEYDGDPVAGGTFPADIFRTFMESALPRFDGPRYFPVPRDDGAVETRVINRDNRWYRDNGRCQNTRVISFVPGRAPAAVAPCKANEVTVPDVIGMQADEASRLLRAQPLLPDVFRKAASPGEQIGVVVDLDPDPAKALSAYDTVKIWVTVAPKGTVPNVVGLPLLEAREKLTNRRLLTAVDGVEDLDAIVVEQSPRGNVAAGEGMTVALKLARGEPDAGRSPRG